MGDRSVEELVMDLARGVRERMPLASLAGTLAPAFDELVARSSPAEAVGLLAATCWDEDARLLEAVAGARSLGVRTGGAGKRIAVYYHGLGTGGAERVTLDLVQLWRAMGKEVLVLCDEGGADGVDLGPGVTIREIPACFDDGRERYGERALALDAALADFRPECLVYGAWLSFVLTWDLLVSRGCGVPFVVMSHGSHRVLTGYGNPRALRLPCVYRHVDAVITLSKEDQAFWSAVNPRCYRTVNKVDARFFQPPAAASEGHTMVWVGRVAPDKSPLEALELLALVRESVPDASLLMVGPFSDPSEEDFRARARELGVAEAVRCMGRVANEELPDLLRQADLMLLTSHFEGYCIALAEAKAMGLPCVTYDLFWLTLVEGGRGVRRAPIGDVDALATEAVALLQDAPTRKRLGREARAHLEEIASFDFVALWTEVLGALSKGRDAEPSPSAQLGALYAETLLEAGIDQLGERAYAQAMSSERDQVRYDLDHVTDSFSFKAGRAVTAPLRLARDVLRRGRS